jgi:single-stranded-DNA-specific exonuclease
MAEPALPLALEPDPHPDPAPVEAAQPELRVVPEADAIPTPAPPPPPRPIPRLLLPPYELDAALGLERQLGISHALAQALVRRGFTEVAAVREFLAPTEESPPEAFAGIERAVALVRRHLAAGARITIHGDYDVDGVCATAIMIRALRRLGADVDWFLPGRIDDGYGLAAPTVERLATRGTGLLITVDCAITAVEEVSAARALGLDVLVTDHHAPRSDGALPDCEIVHPSVCGYPFADLCGTAVAHKLAQALGGCGSEEDLELVALATVADLMPLRGENRRLVKRGLAAMSDTSRPGLRALMAVAKVDPSGLDAHAVGFRLAPRINAAGRLRRADAGLELLLTENDDRARAIAVELDSVNAERRVVEQRIAWEAEALARQLGPRPAYILAAEGWHPGVIGIVASRIVERFHRPAILIAVEGELGSGSGRSIPGFDLLGALHAAAPFLERYGGHRAAAGLTVRREHIDRVAAAVQAHAERVLTPELLEPIERVDAVVSGGELGLALAEELASLEPCGLGNPRCRVLVPGCRFDDVRPMGEGRHARFAVGSAGVRAQAVAFGCDGDVGVSPGTPVDATFTLERNAWNGSVAARLRLHHARACAPEPIEVVGEPPGYLEGVLAELDAPLEAEGVKDGFGHQGGGDGSPAPGAGRAMIDRREESPLAILADARAAGGSVLAVCADVARRLDGIRERIGGFRLASYWAMERDPATVLTARHVVALDPPTSAAAERLLGLGNGYAYMAWGEPELRFAEQMLNFEYGLRGPLASLYRELRARSMASGEDLEPLLRGEGPAGRPARLTGRLIRVLSELGLVSLERDVPALAIAGTAATDLERSPAYRSYQRRLEDGTRYLTSATRRPRG